MAPGLLVLLALLEPPHPPALLLDLMRRLVLQPLPLSQHLLPSTPPPWAAGTLWTS